MFHVSPNGSPSINRNSSNAINPTNITPRTVSWHVVPPHRTWCRLRRYILLCRSISEGSVVIDVGPRFGGRNGRVLLVREVPASAAMNLRGSEPGGGGQYSLSVRSLSVMAVVEVAVVIDSLYEEAEAAEVGRGGAMMESYVAGDIYCESVYAVCIITVIRSLAAYYELPI